MSEMKRVYEANLRFLNEEYAIEGLPPFEELPFLLLPGSETQYRMYDKSKAAYFFSGQRNRVYDLYALLMCQIFEKKDTDLVEKVAAEVASRQATLLWQKMQDSYETSGRVLLEEIQLYHRLRPGCERRFWLMGIYYLHKKEHLMAKKMVEKGLEKRAVNFNLHLLEAQIEVALGNYEAAAGAYAFALNVGKPDVRAAIQQHLQVCLVKLKAISAERLHEGLRRMERVMANGRRSPWKSTFTFNEQNQFSFQSGTYANEYLDQDADGWGFFVGFYNEDSQIDTRASRTNFLKSANGQVAWYVDDVYDYVKAKPFEALTCEKNEVPYLLPMIAHASMQKIDFSFSGTDASLQLGEGEVNLFRIAEETTIRSDHIFSAGKPILLEHGVGRKKLVLNIFLDALSFAWLKQHAYCQMPNIMRFFKKGMIFDNNYSPAEWTYPSIAAMQTGLHIGNTQMFHPDISFKKAAKMKTIPEHFHKAGYYCISVMESPENIYSNVCNGYERLLVNFVTKAYVGVERAIRHLKALKETDVFMTLHALDLHPLFNNAFQIDVETQAKVELKERFFKPSNKSAFREPSVLNQQQYKEAAENVDRVLGLLFDYLERNYADDELLVTLYSDHGVSIFEDSPFLLSELHTSTALMLRGKNVPQRGIVQDEVTNGLDLYPIMAKLEGYEIDSSACDGHLPRALGGEGCLYTISNSLYPGQTYKLCIRTLQHEFQLETEKLTSYDGRIDMNSFAYHIFTRDAAHREVQDAVLAQYFLDIAYEHTKTLHDPDYE